MYNYIVKTKSFLLVFRTFHYNFYSCDCLSQNRLIFEVRHPNHSTLDHQSLNNNMLILGKADICGRKGGKERRSKQARLNLTHLRSQECETWKIHIKCQHNSTEVMWNNCKRVVFKNSNLPRGFFFSQRESTEQ